MPSYITRMSETHIKIKPTNKFVALGSMGKEGRRRYREAGSVFVPLGDALFFVPLALGELLRIPPAIPPPDERWKPFRVRVTTTARKRRKKKEQTRRGISVCESRPLRRARGRGAGGVGNEMHLLKQSW